MSNFLWPIAGGILIGLSATLLLMLTGKIAGISGIVWGVISNNNANDKAWRWLFIVGIVAGTFFFHIASGKSFPDPNENIVLAAIAGLLVGIGVKLGNGCTSGHGVCGIGRLSLRSLVATLTFMGTAILTVAVFNLVINSTGSL